MTVFIAFSRLDLSSWTRYCDALVWMMAETAAVSREQSKSLEIQARKRLVERQLPHGCC